MPKESANIQSLSLEQSFRYCSSFTRKRSWKLWLMSNIMMTARNRGYIYLCHTYFRWVDDYIDDPKRTIEDKKQFMQNQIIFFQCLTCKENVKINSTEELFLSYTVKFAIDSSNNLLICSLRDLLRDMQLDVNRLGNKIIFSGSELNEYITLQSRAFSNIINIFLKPGFTSDNESTCVGEFYWYVLTLRDFLDDLESGYINISKEDLENYNLNYQNLRDDRNRFKWMEDRYKFIMQLFEKEKFVLKSYPMKLKIFWVPGYISLLIELVRIKEYGYLIGVKINKQFFKEIKVLFEAIGIYLKFAFGVYTYFPRRRNQVKP